MKFSVDAFVEIQVAILPADKYAFKCLKSSKKQDKTRGNLFLISIIISKKQSTESNHENRTSKDVVPLPSCVHPKRTCVVSMINRVQKNCG